MHRAHPAHPTVPSVFNILRKTLDKPPQCSYFLYMEIRYRDDDLARLEADAKFTAGFGKPVVRGFRKVVGFIRAASDERDLYAMKSLRFEKLGGDRKGQRSLRINDQWRLIATLEGQAPNKVVSVWEIVDYH